jgi:hypothetical protein
MDTEKQPRDQAISIEKSEEKQPAQTITDTVGDLVASSATLIAHSAEAVVGRIKQATVGSPKPAKKRRPASPASKAKKTKKKMARKAQKTSRGKTMAKKARKKTAKATKKTAKKMMPKKKKLRR